MDLWSPQSLQDLCINSLSERLRVLWDWNGDIRFSRPNGAKWRDPELFLDSRVAEKLLDILSLKGRLYDSILNTFTQDHTCLEHVKIEICYFVTERGLQVLKHHKLKSFEIDCPYGVGICRLLQCIGNKSYDSLQRLAFWYSSESLRGGEFWPYDDLSGQSVVETLSRFNCLRSVDVSWTRPTNSMLTILCKSLLHVENLNLSWNPEITDISPLQNCQKTLKSLSLSGLFAITAESAMATFMTLTGLTYLDVSLEVDNSFGSYEAYSRSLHRRWKDVFTADILLQMPGVIPNLVCLNLSGRTVRSEQALRWFLDAHQSLQMLVLFGSNACQFKSLQDYRPRLTVGGAATLEQYAALLRHHTRMDYHRRIDFCDSNRREIPYRLCYDLTKMPYSPCDDDELVQALLDTIPTRASSLFDQECVWLLGEMCLHAISVLLKKQLIRHLEPDTRKHLLMLCKKGLQECPTGKTREFAEECCKALENQKVRGAE